MSASPISVSITRSDSYVESFDVYARVNGYPIEEGDGIFVANIPISPSQTTVTSTWTPPADGTWKFIAVPIYRGVSGPIGRLT